MLTVCVAGAVSPRLNPTTLANDVGAVVGWPSTVRLRPAGLVASVTVVTLGATSRVVVVVRPPASVTLNVIR